MIIKNKQKWADLLFSPTRSTAAVRRRSNLNTGVQKDLTSNESNLPEDLNIAQQKTKSLEDTVDMSERLANLLSQIEIGFDDMTARIDAMQHSQATNLFILQRQQDQIRDLKLQLCNRV